jgi:hypothetical protein
MPFAPEVQQLIRQVEQSSGLPVHVAAEPGMRLRATIVQARGNAAAHLLRYKPGSPNLDYLVANQLGFLSRTLSLPPAERWDIAATAAEKDEGIRAMGLSVFKDDFARSMMDQIITQTRSYPVGLRVDSWMRMALPGLRNQQDAEIRSQLAENERALAPEIRSKFPKGIVDANTSMNAAFATYWAGVLGEPRFTIPYTALGYGGIAGCLLAVLGEVPEDASGDRTLVARWGEILGLTQAFHFDAQNPEAD